MEIFSWTIFIPHHNNTDRIAMQSYDEKYGLKCIVNTPFRSHVVRALSHESIFFKQNYISNNIFFCFPARCRNSKAQCLHCILIIKMLEIIPSQFLFSMNSSSNTWNDYNHTSILWCNTLRKLYFPFVLFFRSPLCFFSGLVATRFGRYSIFYEKEWLFIYFNNFLQDTWNFEVCHSSLLRWIRLRQSAMYPISSGALNMKNH